MSNIKQRRRDANDHTWSNLTEGRLRCLYRLTNEAAKKGDPIAHDCAHDLYNFFYEHGLAESIEKVV